MWIAFSWAISLSGAESRHSFCHHFLIPEEKVNNVNHPLGSSLSRAWSRRMSWSGLEMLWPSSILKDCLQSNSQKMRREMAKLLQTFPSAKISMVLSEIHRWPLLQCQAKIVDIHQHKGRWENWLLPGRSDQWVLCNEPSKHVLASIPPSCWQLTRHICTRISSRAVFNHTRLHLTARQTASLHTTQHTCTQHTTTQHTCTEKHRHTTGAGVAW